ncbi:DUF3052 domain-containing protein [Streptomyces sp. NPDC056144]|uniref:DUF3052 domain-containing protein n=1 Tax=unclassified Streptomyces TaxID=2593676 RepID=UPI0035D817AB
MTSTASIADKLGIEPGAVVQELGWDEDCDDSLRPVVEERTGRELLDEQATETVGVVLLWWREDDGDLTDALVGALGPLARNGAIWVLTPKVGRHGYVEPSDVAEAAISAGLSRTSAVSVGEDWSGTRLVPSKTAQPR